MYTKEMFGLRPPRSTLSPPNRRAKEIADGTTPSKGSSRLLRSQLTPFYLGDRSQNGVGGRVSKRDNCNEEGIALGGHHMKEYGR